MTAHLALWDGWDSLLSVPENPEYRARLAYAVTLCSELDLKPGDCPHWCLVEAYVLYQAHGATEANDVVLFDEMLRKVLGGTTTSMRFAMKAAKIAMESGVPTVTLASHGPATVGLGVSFVVFARDPHDPERFADFEAILCAIENSVPSKRNAA